jgi:hypothetical protein
MMIFGGGTAFHHPAIFHLRNPICEGKNAAVMSDDNHAAVGGAGTPLEKFQGMVAGLGIQ